MGLIQQYQPARLLATQMRMSTAELIFIPHARFPFAVYSATRPGCVYPWQVYLTAPRLVHDMQFTFQINHTLCYMIAKFSILHLYNPMCFLCLYMIWWSHFVSAPVRTGCWCNHFLELRTHYLDKRMCVYLLPAEGVTHTISHEKFKPQYANKITMLSAIKLSIIPRSDFYFRL